MRDVIRKTLHLQEDLQEMKHKILTLKNLRAPGVQDTDVTPR